MFTWLRPKESLSDTEVEHGLRMLLMDGAFAQTMAVLSTGAFLVGFGLILGASNTVIGLLAAVGPVAQILQLPAIFMVERLRRRKLASVVCFGASRLSLLGVALIPWLVPIRFAIPLFLILLMLHCGLGAIGGCAFNSWFRDLVPEQRLGSFLARRLAVATFFGAVLSFAGGYGIDLYTNVFGDKQTAYGLVFAIASVSGIFSVIFIGRIPEPTMPKDNLPPLGVLLMQPLRDKNYRNLLIFLGAWSFAVNFAGPFFAVYLIKYLHLSMTWVLGLSVLSQMCNVIFFGVWGRLSERFSNKSVLVFSVPLFFFAFLLWPFTTMPEPHFFTMPLLITIHVLAGISTAGVALCAANLAFKSAPYGRAASYMAVNALICGVAAALSPILAGFAADWFGPYEARLTLHWLQWENATEVFELPTIIIRGLDFIFLIGFGMGIYSIHRLLAVREQGEVAEKVLRQAFYEEMGRMVRQISTVAGMRQLLTIPFPYRSSKRPPEPLEEN